ncbi:hypothetical protein CerSpe_013290 [Prunus speciosa]
MSHNFFQMLMATCCTISERRLTKMSLRRMKRPFQDLVLFVGEALVGNDVVDQLSKFNQGSLWPLGFLMKYCSMLRNHMLANPSFLFKVGTEIVIDSCCATFAEVQKRGKDFWAEFELYAVDLLVGIAVDVALVGMLAPYARIGKSSVSRGLFRSELHHFICIIEVSCYY